MSSDRSVFHAQEGTSVVAQPGRAQRSKQLDAHASMIMRLDELQSVADIDVSELQEAPEPLSVPSKMIAFFAPKGGVGATTLSINVAGVLAQLKRQTVVVDMDLQLGAVPVSLNLHPERSVAEIVMETQGDGEGPLRSGLDMHPSGIQVLSQGDRIEELGVVTPDKLPRMFDALGQSFEFVVVDGLRDFSDNAVAVMDLAHVIVLVITQDVPAVRAAARSLQVFQRLGYGGDRIRLIVNRYRRNCPLTIEAIQNALGVAVSAVVTNDFPVVEQALNMGCLLSDVKPQSAVARDAENFALLLAGYSPKPAKGFFARLFGR